MYKLTNNGVINLDTSANIPNCEGNADWQQYQIWLNKGNTPEPADPTPSNNTSILSQIQELEQKCERAIRDAILSQDMTYLTQYNQQIEALRTQLIKE